MSEQRQLDHGRYVLDREPIASGGMGTVWRGYDRKLKRTVAVKEVRALEGMSESERDIQRARVMSEARAAARLDHPGIVAVYDVIEDDGRPWIVMRLVPGRSLAQEVEESGPLSPRRAAEVGLRVLDALAAAHAESILHRDVKPQNVLLDADGKAVLGDFGIALVTGVTRPVTEAGLVVGTLGYVAPERLSGAAPGPESDLWSLGATLYFAVEGRQAYETGDVVTTIAAIVTRDPEPMRRAGPLASVIAGLMVRDIDGRLTADAAREHLRAAASGRPVPDEATTLLREPDARTKPFPDAPRQILPPITPDSEQPSDRPLIQRGRMWGVAFAAAILLVAGGVAVGTLLADGGDGAPGPERSPKVTSSPTPELHRFATAPKVCQSNLFSKARVEDLVSNPEPGAMINDASVNRCEWETESKYLVASQLSVHVLVNDSGKAAANLFEEPKDLAEGHPGATVRHPNLGDRADLMVANHLGEARVRISNLTLEVRYAGDYFGEDEFTTLVREIVATAEAEGS